MSNAAQNFDTLATNLNVLHNYFDSSTKFQQTIDSSTNFSAIYYCNIWYIWPPTTS